MRKTLAVALAAVVLALTACQPVESDSRDRNQPHELDVHNATPSPSHHPHQGASPRSAHS
jgi:protein involved in sex pheromone biosynthesis